MKSKLEVINTVILPNGDTVNIYRELQNGYIFSVVTNSNNETLAISMK